MLPIGHWGGVRDQGGWLLFENSSKDNGGRCHENGRGRKGRKGNDSVCISVDKEGTEGLHIARWEAGKEKAPPEEGEMGGWTLVHVGKEKENVYLMKRDGY